ncbi:MULTISPECIES: dihydrofolate reductase family protein [Micromonospora]|uniref:Dihydrofolate reductase n=1 Tax=Micromonospora solifontis TaxID=2487138 RepID=A0ABX9WN11_9ACTN|nr:MULTISPECIES: dihydrofolate reductase family protein [Micromonospora]NES14786.1 dihydrofolate reductase family protein [Micromonospora sp. PPF5-17B]NES35350.1 dihydrofolate reductase family protein [Micromonospora solifontis]NES56168.1 dihydrofolate reductase family protein [Micromonospora sp. PPF5-6]RNM00847.1 dihydrofolate reductase [Micromonospora solifontis]
MTQVTGQISVSLDGYVAAPGQSKQDPLGRGGLRLHEWLFAADRRREQHGLDGAQRDVDAAIVDELTAGVGAYVMGRRMFGGGEGAWDLGWTGWWGDDPPWHVPVFVLTHHPRESVVMRGGTEYHFVTDGIEAALKLARAAAGDRDVAVAGGGSATRQYLAAGLLDTLWLHVVPIVLGGGTPLFDGPLDGITLEPARVVPAPAVTHVQYRIRPGTPGSGAAGSPRTSS